MVRKKKRVVDPFEAFAEEHKDYRNWSVYNLKDPLTRRVRYVGITSYADLQKRLEWHISSPVYPEMKEWIEGLVAVGLKPIIEKLDMLWGTEAQAKQREIRYQFHFIQLGENLFNHTFNKDIIARIPDNVLDDAVFGRVQTVFRLLEDHAICMKGGCREYSPRALAHLDEIKEVLQHSRGKVSPELLTLVEKTLGECETMIEGWVKKLARET